MSDHGKIIVTKRRVARSFPVQAVLWWEVHLHALLRLEGHLHALKILAMIRRRIYQYALKKCVHTVLVNSDATILAAGINAIAEKNVYARNNFEFFFTKTASKNDSNILY